MNMPDPALLATAATLNGAAPLTELGVIRAVGDEAAKFLQGQLTQDVVLLKPGHAHLAAFCNPKGRMLASFIALKRAEDEILLICSQDVLAAALKRLSMFVMRAKAKLSDASAQFTLHGLIGEAAVQGESLVQGVNLCPLAPADGAPRALRVAEADAPPPAASSLDPALWRWADVRSGVAMVTQPVVETFVPQMLNYESAGGVNFKKGCYPGQEVVARSQFRGAIKRRAFVAQVDGAAQAGQEVFSPADPEQPCGTIALAAPAPGGGTAVIVSLQTAALERVDELAVGAAEGPTLTGWQVPYPLLADI
ncbi:MAG: folate-binding protein [Ottowia sp.]